LLSGSKRLALWLGDGVTVSGRVSEFLFVLAKIVPIGGDLGRYLVLDSLDVFRGESLEFLSELLALGRFDLGPGPLQDIEEGRPVSFPVLFIGGFVFLLDPVFYRVLDSWYLSLGEIQELPKPGYLLPGSFGEGGAFAPKGLGEYRLIFIEILIV